MDNLHAIKLEIENYISTIFNGNLLFDSSNKDPIVFNNCGNYKSITIDQIDFKKSMATVKIVPFSAVDKIQLNCKGVKICQKQKN